MKDLGTVCFARPNDAGLEIWYEVLRNKQIRKTILPMQTLEIDDLVPKGEGALQDVAPNLSENYMLADGIRALRFTLLRDQKSKSYMWWFLEKCHKHEIDVKALGKVPVSVMFKKTDKTFNFETYMESKGMKVKAAEVGEASQPESSKKKKSKKSLNPTKKTSEAEKPKKTKTKTVNTASDIEAIKKTKSIQGTTVSSGQTKGDTSTTIRPAGVGEGGSVNMSTLDDAEKNKNQREVVVMEVTDDEEEESVFKVEKAQAHRSN
ncbi:hypothetical protein R1sor_011619 [Riccia sorocarpa]|uniref:Uncharacterized protein n=1 Tax=Riccia sorocarpa TaxID=122646 RepID=A0ABD3I1E1_9MARC